MKLNAVVAAFLAMILVGVTFLATRVVIGRPIGRLQQAIERMRTSHTRERVDWQSADELGRVVDAFNDLQDQQAAAEVALRQARDELERRVTERTEELAKTETQLRAAIDNMSGGIFVIDKDLNIVLCNDRLRQLYDLPDDVVQEGKPLEGILRIRAARGEYGLGDPQELIHKRIEDYRDMSVRRVEDHVKGGRIIELYRAPMALSR